MEILKNLPEELHWQVMKYMRHPCVDILKESNCFIARESYWNYYHKYDNWDDRQHFDEWEKRCFRLCKKEYNIFA